MQQIPYEILDDIFRIVLLSSRNKRNLFNCTLVCRSWYLPASRILYENLNVGNISQLYEHLNNQKNNMGVYCRKLQFNRTHKRELLPPEFYEQLFSYLPNLQTIILDHCFARTHHLNQIAQHAESLKYVREISLQGYSWHPEESQAYYYCIMAFKDNIQHMKLVSLGEIISTVDGRFENIISILSEFTTLTTLQIKNRENTNPPNLPQLSMIFILRSCPSLISFSLESDFLGTEDDLDNYSFDHSRLRYLCIDSLEITRGHIGYMLMNITRLKRFKLRIGTSSNTSDPIPWMEKIGPGHLNRLQKFLNGIERVEFIVGESFKTDLTEYWSFISGVISNNCIAPTFILIKMGDISNRISGEKMILKKYFEGITLLCQMDFREFSSIILLLSSVVLLELSEINVQSFHFLFEYSRYRTYILRNDVLRNVINCFPNLQKFIVEIGISYSDFYSIEVGSGETDDKKYDYDMDCFVINYPRRPIQSSEKLAHVTLRNMQSTQDIISTLNLFPNTRYLKLLECILDPNNEYNYDLDFSNLNLRQLTLDITKLVVLESGKKTIVLEVEEEQCNRTSCYKWDRRTKSFNDMAFEPIETSYLSKYKRNSSFNFKAIMIRCHKLEKIKIYVQRTKQDPIIEANLNLTSQ